MFDFDKKNIYLRDPDIMLDVVEWSIALDIGLSDWYCSTSKVVSSNPVEGDSKLFSLKF